jgi:RsiW-degrading membrane proteinase PrsW (M82 family)
VPVAATVWAWEHAGGRGLTARRLVVAFLGGGGVSMLGAALLEGWLLPAGSVRFLVIGLVEEVSRAAMLVLVASGLGRVDRRTGLVLGAAVGFGYAALESSGYALNAFDGLVSAAGAGSGLRNMLGIEVERAVLSPMLHGLWTAVAGGLLLPAVRGGGRLRLGVPALCALLLVACLHATWDGMDSVAAFVAAAAPSAAGPHDAAVYWVVELLGCTGVGLVGAAALAVVWRGNAWFHSWRRTMSRPATIARSFAKARSRDRYFMPQSGASTSRSGSTWASAARTRSAISRGVSTGLSSDRSRTPSTTVLRPRRPASEGSSRCWADSIETWSAAQSASSSRKG